MEFAESQRGGRKLLWNGYIYTYQKELANQVTSWECVLRRSGQCKARIKLSMSDEFLEAVNEHTHAPSATSCELAQIRSNIKRKSETTHDTTQQILTVELQNISDDAAVHLPIVGNLRHTIRSQRQTRNHYPIQTSREEIPEIPNEFRFLENGEEFLLYDSGSGDVNRILIFGTHQNLQLLNNSEQGL